MQKIFHNILMPVYLDKKTDTDIAAAVDFSNQLDCHLHLFFIDKPALFNWYGKKEIGARQKARIVLIRQKFQFRLKNGLKLYTACQTETNYFIIAKYAETHDIDMVLASERIRYRDFPNKYLAVVNCPVISLQHDAVTRPLKTIVLPVGNSFPINQIRIAAYIARHLHLSIHLLSWEKDMFQEEKGYLKRTFELLKNNTELQVVCHSVTGKRLDKLAIEYAAAHAGMIMLNAEKEQMTGRLFSRLLSKFTQKETLVPVITVE